VTIETIDIILSRMLPAAVFFGIAWALTSWKWERE
jgi:lipopolysaccharide export LptBFGC system permease protein LptF